MRRARTGHWTGAVGLAHRVLLIVPSREEASERWQQEGIGNWATAFPLRLERAGLLDFDVADETALDDPDQLTDRDLVIVANLSAGAWTAARQRNLHSLSAATFIEGPVPCEISGAELIHRSGEPPAILLDDSSEVIRLTLARPRTRPMRFDPSLVPRDRYTGTAMPIPPPSDGIEVDLAPATAWYRGPDMNHAFHCTGTKEVLARRAADGAAVVVRDGPRCCSAVPLLGWLCQAYATPPLYGTFINRPMRTVKRVECWLVDLLLRLAAENGRPLLRVAPWPGGAKFACTIAHDVDRIPKPADFDRLLDWERRTGVKSSWYWIASRLDPPRIEQIAASGFEIGLHAVLAARKSSEIAELSAAMVISRSIRGETLHGGAGGDYWRGAASVLQAHSAGLTYTEHCPNAHDLPDTGFALLRGDGCVEIVPIIGLTHAVCLERNPVKEEEVYHRETLDRLATAGAYCLISNHPDMSFNALQEWVEGLPLDYAWHATAAEVAAWWRASHDRSALVVFVRPNGEEETEITVTAHEGVAGLVLAAPVSAPVVQVEGGQVISRMAGETLISIDVPAGEARTVLLRAYDRPRRVAIAGSEKIAPSQIPAFQNVVGLSEPDATQVHLSSHGRHIDAARAVADNPAFLFAPIAPPVDLMLVLPQTAGLFANAFTAAWLGTLLINGEAREILIGRGSGEFGSRLADTLRRAFPETVVDEADEQWLRLRPGIGLGECVFALPTAYPLLHRASRRFLDLYAIVEHRDAADLIAAGNGEGPAEASFRYSMIGASRKSLVLERLAQRSGWGSRPRLLDIGGGHGFLGLELAAKGWTVTVVDHDPAKTELLGPWLARLSPRSLPIEYRTLSMERIAADDAPCVPSELDAVTFFESLLFAPRDRVGAILRACWQRLAPGGALVIRELVRRQPGEHLHDLRFERDELIDLVAENAQLPSYISLLDGSAMSEFQPGPSALVSRKLPAENAGPPGGRTANT